MALATFAWGSRARGAAIAVLLFLVYVWTDFPINYAAFGMLPYLLAIPLGLLATGVFTAFLNRGGFLRWSASAILMSLACHGSPHGRDGRGSRGDDGLSCGPDREQGRDERKPSVRACRGAVYPATCGGLDPASGRSCRQRILVASGSLARLDQGAERLRVRSLFRRCAPPSPANPLHRGRGPVASDRDWLAGTHTPDATEPHPGAALAGFCLAGFFWGYLAGGFKALDFLQPGRQTYAFYTALAVAGGVGLDALFLRLRGGGTGIRFDRWAMASALLIGFRFFGPSLMESLRARLVAGEPFLSSRPSPRLLWVVDRVKAHVKPGERLLYEEGGKDLPGIPDPFQHGRFSGLLPDRTGVELIGGPYLHAALTTNFTQFGEGALFGKVNWDRDDFVKYARLYRPSAILCWSPRARRFCRSNPDLITILDDEGTLLIGRVLGFGGDAIEGRATVAAEAGRLRVSAMTPGVDGSIVLRYHSVPSLRARPPVPLELRQEEGDPVPFIGLRPPSGTREVELEMVVPFQVSH